MYESYGGHITLFSDFGKDPLSERRDLSSLREERFFERTQDLMIYFTLLLITTQHYSMMPFCLLLK